MIIFVGDQPSSKNVDPNIPFVGTQSYKRLLEWIWEMDVDINNVHLCNKDQFEHNYLTGDLYISNLNSDLPARASVCKIVVLGNQAEDKVCETSTLDYFKLPHPSGRNRKINDKKFIKKELKKCKEWLNE